MSVLKNVLFLTLLTTGLACTADLAAQDRVQPAAFETLIQKEKGAHLLDVRTPQEFAAGHIAGAKNINFYDTDFKVQIAKLDKSKPVLVYCAVGGRSNTAAKQMKSMGFTRVYDLAGGINAWRAQGKPLKQ